MADKHKTDYECVPDISKLRAEVAALVSRRIEAVTKESKDEDILKVLGRRRKKWMRRKHKLVKQEYCPVDPALGDEKETLTFQLAELKVALAKRRKEGLTHARRKQGEKHTHCLNVVSEWQHRSRQSLQDYRESQCRTENRVELQPSVSESAEGKLVQELEDTILQVEALRGIREMKHHATPRLPQLHPNNHPILTHSDCSVEDIIMADTPEISSLPDLLLNTEECDVVYTASGHESEEERNDDTSVEYWLQETAKNPPENVGTDKPRT